MKKKVVLISIIVLLVIAIIAVTVVVLVQNKPWENKIESKEDNKEELQISDPVELETIPRLPEDKTDINYKLKDESKDIVYTYMEKYEKFTIPQINIDSQDVEKINEEILSIFNEVLSVYEENLVVDRESADYFYYISNNILSLIIESETESASTKNYLIYNIDLTTGNQISNKELIKKYDITETGFKDKLNESIKNSIVYDIAKEMKSSIENGNPSEFKTIAELETFVQEQINDSIDFYKDKDIEDIDIFINNLGNLSIAIHVSPLVGGGATQISDLETGESIFALKVYREDFVKGEANDYTFCKYYSKPKNNNILVYSYIKGEYLEKDASYTYNYKIDVPQININSTYIDKVNKEILNLYENEIENFIKEKGFLNFQAESMQYKSYENGNIISICLYVTTEGADLTTFVYNFDKNGNKVSNEEILEQYGINEEEFKSKLINKIENLDFYNDYIANMYYDEEVTNTVNKYKDEAINNFKMYVNGKGNLSLAIEIYVGAGSGHSNILLDIETGKIDM